MKLLGGWGNHVVTSLFEGEVLASSLMVFATLMAAGRLRVVVLLDFDSLPHKAL